MTPAGGHIADRGDDRRRVLEATDIVRLVGEHVALKARGREYVCLCPFHDDHKPSMYVVPAKGIYHCFSCGAGGNALDFVMNFHKMDFREALTHLAERAGVTLTPWRPERGVGGVAARVGEEGDGVAGGSEGSGGSGVTRAELLAATGFAAEFFRVMLRHEEHGAAARAVLERRGVAPEMVEAFELGAAPDRWDGLALTSAKKGVRAEALRGAGLLKRRENAGGDYDAFRHRLMFPIHDQIGRVIAFGGRKIRDEDEPKYLNSPESALFDKSRTLFGLKQAFRAIQRERRAIVVEGYMDVIACHQAGVCNAVATMGTALTAEHARVLERVCDVVTLVFDGDDAGARAADRAVEVFFTHPIDVRIAVLAGAKDPDELLKQPDGRARFDEAIAAAADALEYRCARLSGRTRGAGMSALARMVEEDLERLSDLGLARVSPVRRRMVIKRLAGLAGVGEEDILAALRRLGPRRPAAPQTPGIVDPANKQRAPLATRAIDESIGALLSEPGLWASVSSTQRDMLRDGAYAPPLTAAVARAAVSLLESGITPTMTELSASLEDPDVRRHAAALASRADVMTDGDTQRLQDLLDDCLATAAAAGSALASTRRGNPDAQTHAMTLTQRLEALKQERSRFVGVAAVIPRPDTIPSAGSAHAARTND